MEPLTFGLRVSASQWGLWGFGAGASQKQAKRDHGAPNAKLGTAHGGLSAWQSRCPQKLPGSGRAVLKNWSHFQFSYPLFQAPRGLTCPPPIGGQGDGGGGHKSSKGRRDNAISLCDGSNRDGPQWLAMLLP
ncbi:predicted protein [Chaetomium globosum CBS 148.51]|uniref:Uncharacterized protein n=1 Tax=Chaetomium globosum (strain ATCC 6205 / CBS 148.51 / DSM 1962 / NBRC 6347 / NRRL 1970) TaxID=306901 RepID=Q2HGR3_CHAGB|nr:uncharacterized protein CHGG_00591 [Chaetomium globosum CBS 148.51]EAQ92356.1 predicted protein [Chaetomium globosum CBS 148.51]